MTSGIDDLLIDVLQSWSWAINRLWPHRQLPMKARMEGCEGVRLAVMRRWRSDLTVRVLT
jgi:hypothetical protein